MKIMCKNSDPRSPNNSRTPARVYERGVHLATSREPELGAAEVAVLGGRAVELARDEGGQPPLHALIICRVHLQQVAAPEPQLQVRTRPQTAQAALQPQRVSVELESFRVL